MNRQILTLNNASVNPVLNILHDFESHFFNLNNMIDWDADVPTLRSTLIDRTGFPRANREIDN